MNETKPPPTLPARIATPMDPVHLADLKRSFLTDKIIAEAQIKSARPEDISMILGFDPPGVHSVMLFPYPGASGNFFRAKLFPPLVDRAGHPMKYFQRPGTRSHLYIPASVRNLLGNPSISLTIVEGEKKTLRAIQEGFPAVGIGGLWSFLYNKELLPELVNIAWARREVVFYPDSDVWARPDLLRPVYALAWELENRGAEVHIGILNPGPNGEKRGLDDFPKLDIDLEHNSINDVNYVGLKHKSFSVQRAWHAEWKKEKAEEKDSTLQGRPMFQREVEPSRDPVDGPQLLEVLTLILRRYVVLPLNAEVAIALWIMQTYCPDTMSCLPILAVTSATKREGKTTLLELVMGLCAKPCPTSNISPAALFRMTEAWAPTLICDEMDTQFKDNFELRTIFTASHTRPYAFVQRIVGDKLEPRNFNIFGSKALGMIGKLPSTMQDRSIEIRMRRKARGQKVSRIIRLELEKECAPLRSRIVRWMEDNVNSISEQTATTPTDLDDRAADNWRGLFALAFAAGGSWPQRTAQAALSLSEIRKEDVSIGEELLADLRQIYGDRERMFTTDIVTRLNKMEDRLWPTALRGKPIGANWLGQKLKPFNIKPRLLRFGVRVARGYERVGPMEDAFNTYLTPPGLSDTVLQSEESQGDTEGSSRYRENLCNGLDSDLTTEKDSFRNNVTVKEGGVEGASEMKADAGMAEDLVWKHFEGKQREEVSESGFTKEQEAAHDAIWKDYFEE